MALRRLPDGSSTGAAPDLTGSFRYRLVVPDLPAPSEYLPLLEEISENGWYSNFGPLALGSSSEAELVPDLVLDALDRTLTRH
jgi:hypothetical protein